MNSWSAKLAHCLELGTADVSILADLDSILSWYSASSKQNDEFRLSLTKKYNDTELSVRFEEFLDRMVVSDAAVGQMFPPTLSTDIAKKRYRQLIRIFHPDRGAKEEVWLNYRAERVNKAYKLYEQQGGEIIAQIEPVTVAKPRSRPVNGASKPRPAVKFTYRPSVWRQRLGSAKDVQRKMIYGLVGFSCFLLLVFLAPSLQTEPPAEATEASFVQADSNPELANSDQVTSELSQSSKNVLNEAAWLDEETSTENDLELDTGFDRQIASPSSELVESTNESPKTDLIEADLNQAAEDRQILEKPALQQSLTTSVVQPKPLTTVVTQAKKEGVNEAEQRQPQALAKAEPSPVTNSVCSGLIASSPVAKSRQEVQLVFESFMRVGPDSKCRRSKHLAENTHLTKLKCTTDGSWCFVQQDSRYGLAQSGWIKANQLSVRTKPEIDPAVNIVKQDPLEQNKPAKAEVESEPSASDVASAGLPTGSPTGLPPSVSAKSAPKRPAPVTQPSLNSVVSEIFSRYKRYFESGDHERLAGLFMSSARENKMRGIDAISNYYRRAFKTTYNRDFDIYLDSLDAQGETSAVAKGRLSVAADFNKSGKRDLNRAEFRMVFLKVEGKYKIAVFEWKRA